MRTLNSSTYMGKVTDAGIANALAWVLTKNAEYSRIAATFIDAFFASNTTGMNPNINYGQVVRGPPGNQLGSFMAVVDLRGVTKISNAIQLLRQTNAPDWNLDRDKRMVNWAKAYINWLQTSPVGKKAAQAAKCVQHQNLDQFWACVAYFCFAHSNHGSFFVNQAAVLHILIGDYAGAKTSLTNFFSSIFTDQITASGEQPFEAIRTRPFHYRCFNIEALIVNAKLADQLGLNMWQARSKYNATIQTAIEYTMKLDPQAEDPTELVPHLMVAAAVYGDPKGKYMAYVKNVMPDYDAQIYQFYDQAGAFTSSPASGSSTKSTGRKRGIVEQEAEGEEEGEADMDSVGGYVPSFSHSEPMDEDQQPRPVSDWHSVKDFTKLAPPLALRGF